LKKALGINDVIKYWSVFKNISRTGSLNASNIFRTLENYIPHHENALKQFCMNSLTFNFPHYTRCITTKRVNKFISVI